MFRNFISRIQDTIDLISPDKEAFLNVSILNKFIDMSIGMDIFKDLMDKINPSWNE